METKSKVSIELEESMMNSMAFVLSDKSWAVERSDAGWERWI